MGFAKSSSRLSLSLVISAYTITESTSFYLGRVIGPTGLILSSRSSWSSWKHSAELARIRFHRAWGDEDEWMEGRNKSFLFFFDFMLFLLPRFASVNSIPPFASWLTLVLFFVLVLSPVLVLSRTTFIQTNNSRNMDWDEFKAYVLSSFEVYIPHRSSSWRFFEISLVDSGQGFHEEKLR